MEPDVAGAVVAGIAEACRQTGCALIGGETAEMPGLYAAGDYDVAGFAIGAVERGRQITGAGIVAGDAVLGLASSGVHSNGFSLVRRIVADAGLSYGDTAPFDPDTTLGAALMTPTRLYTPAMISAARAGLAKGFAHITGGGLVENIPRVLPSGLGVVLDARAWPLSAVFRWLKACGGLGEPDMARTFNCGIGMVAVVADADADQTTRRLEALGETVFRIGRVGETSGPRVAIENAAEAWSADPDTKGHKN